MARYEIQDIENQLNENLQVGEGIIGIQYSILTWSTTLKDPKKIASRLFDNGHAECFLLEKMDDGVQYITSGIGDEWVFETKDEDDDTWLRDTPSTDTFVYYVKVDDATVARFHAAVDRLEDEPVTYSVLKPNVPGFGTNFQNCVSGSHKLLQEVGIGWPHKGWWMPSLDSWSQWFASKMPFTSYDGNPWCYKKLASCNCYDV